MSEFAENDVIVCQLYILSDRAMMDAVKEALSSAFSTPIQSHAPNGRPINEDALARRDASLRLHSFLTSNDVVNVFDVLSGVYAHMERHNFSDAKSRMKDLGDPLPGISNADLEEAFATDGVSFIEFTGVDAEGEPVSDVRFLKGYDGPALDAQQLAAARQIISGGQERRFRIGLLNAEIELGNRRFGHALAEYRKIIKDTALTRERRQFAVIRAGYAHLAEGDFEFRASGNPTVSERIVIRNNYANAADIVNKPLAEEIGGVVVFIGVISPENPLRNQIERYYRITR